MLAEFFSRQLTDMAMNIRLTGDDKYQFGMFSEIRGRLAMLQTDFRFVELGRGFLPLLLAMPLHRSAHGRTWHRRILAIATCELGGIAHVLFGKAVQGTYFSRIYSSLPGMDSTTFVVDCRLCRQGYVYPS